MTASLEEQREEFRTAAKSSGFSRGRRSTASSHNSDSNNAPRDRQRHDRAEQHERERVQHVVDQGELHGHPHDRDVNRHPRADDFERDEQRQDHEHEDSEQPGRLWSDEHDVRPVHVV